MASGICMNDACRATTSAQWKDGWVLKSGGLATLCHNCGLAYENSVFCETFHLQESGWRDCKFCGKHIHCGCIASKCLHDYLDLGGVGCLSCIICSESQLISKIQIPSDDIFSGLGTLAAICDPQPSVIENHMDGNVVGKEKIMQLTKTMEENQTNGPNIFLQSQKGGQNSSIVQTKREENMLPAGEVGTGFSHLSQQSCQSSLLSKPDGNRPTLGLKDMYESLAPPSLNFSFSVPLSTPNSVLPLPGGVVEGREKNKIPPFQQGQRTRHILPKPSKSGTSVSSQGNKGAVTQTRVARPPVEGRGRSQLLPRYWPRITDQELQKICGDLNSTIVPLFEKVLSASDAGRIGRLVLPKACAEAYFPPINQSEGVAIRMKDIKGNEWTFQFRFWPNNNSRMYVLEGVTPCIQNMQLQAGDTVTFSRIDPEGKLVMGCRKASNSVDIQDTKRSALPNGAPSGDSTASGVNEDLPTDTFGWRKNEEHGGKMNGDSMHQQMEIPEKKKSRNIGSKSKRLLMHSEDAIELRITWEEAQELLRPPPSAKPTIVMVDNHEFEEYDVTGHMDRLSPRLYLGDHTHTWRPRTFTLFVKPPNMHNNTYEPPVFGKRTIFTTRESGEQEQWAQCDSCSKWRRLTVDILVPAKWVCSDNIWDSNRCSCSDPDEIDPKKLESYFRGSKDFKKRRFTENRISQECEASGLDALATAAVLGDNVEDSGEPSVGVTTRHPRHRPGCTCIVCIQPPSGKGKHKPTCICNVCMTVKRRFKTLMLRKKKRQEREAEIEREKGQIPLKDESELEGTSENALLHVENERGKNEIQMEVAGSSKGHLDLNCDPNREEEMLLAEATRMRMSILVHATHPPMEEMYTRQNGDPNCMLYRTVGGSEGPPPDEGFLASSIDIDVEQEKDDGNEE